MTEFRTIKELCTIVADCPHSTPKWTEQGRIVLRSNNIKHGWINLSAPSYTDEDNFQQRIKRAVPQSGDIVITREAPMGEVGMIPDGVECCLGQRMVLLRANSEICDNYYLLYSIQSTYVQHQISWSEGTGTTVSNLRIPHLEQIKIPYVPLEKQKKIASVLKCIEEKIRNNQKINENLEQQLHILFIKIFNGISTDVILGDVVDTTSGGTPSRKHTEYYENGSICWVKSKELLGNYILDTEEHINDIALSKSSAKLLPSHSVLIAMYGATVGAHGIISKSMTCNQAVCALLCNEKYPYTYLFQIAQEQQQKLINMAVGSAQQNISQILIKQLLLHSDISSIRKFHDLALPLHKQIEELQAENRTLSEMRDTLLPQLMSGELDVSDIDL